MQPCTSIVLSTATSIGLQHGFLNIHDHCRFDCNAALLQSKRAWIRDGLFTCWPYACMETTDSSISSSLLYVMPSCYFHARMIYSIRWPLKHADGWGDRACQCTKYIAAWECDRTGSSLLYLYRSCSRMHDMEEIFVRRSTEYLTYRTRRLWVSSLAIQTRCLFARTYCVCPNRKQTTISAGDCLGASDSFDNMYKHSFRPPFPIPVFIEWPLYQQAFSNRQAALPTPIQ